MDDRTPSTDAPTRLAQRRPVTERETIETEAPEVVDKVAALLGQWVEEPADQ